MIGFCTVLFLGCFSAVLGAVAPPYVQSRDAFNYVKTYISTNLPAVSLNVHKQEDKKHSSFSLLAGITASIVLVADKYDDYDGLQVLYDELPFIWAHYSYVSSRANTLLNDASQKVSMISRLIDSCGSENVKECNANVDAQVKQSPYIFELPAGLLLALGKASNVIKSNETVINSLILNNGVVPHLIHNVETDDYKDLIVLLLDAYTKWRELNLRKLYSL